MESDDSDDVPGPGAYDVTSLDKFRYPTNPSISFGPQSVNTPSAKKHMEQQERVRKRFHEINRRDEERRIRINEERLRREENLIRYREHHEKQKKKLKIIKIQIKQIKI